MGTRAREKEQVAKKSTSWGSAASVKTRRNFSTKGKMRHKIVKGGIGYTGGGGGSEGRFNEGENRIRNEKKNKKIIT